ncbi:MAG: hypothetical protein KME25_21295 [Symplocastrum torsivum CPER-KK1]|uniref:Uncharacterized protein n=1 Tax=Symplocastrum torsivum CPER-KK1 TaxID=450513 RepID=A0A951PQI7_9CYAN|nr:hypothetical protein [Symplocastrum torsivum CPER-KK1]
MLINAIAREERHSATAAKAVETIAGKLAQPPPTSQHCRQLRTGKKAVKILFASNISLHDRRRHNPASRLQRPIS